MSYREKGDRLMYVLIACGAVPLVVWRMYAHTQSMWPDFFLRAYLLTGVLFGILLIGDYPRPGTRWFWKSMIPIFVMHGLILAALLNISVQATPLDLQLPTRMIYGLVGVVVVLEWWLCLRIISMFRPKAE
jgi:hypothetical protein